MKYLKTALRLREILQERKMTAQELSDKSGVGKSSISHYYNGNNAPHTINAGKMADVLGVNPMWLMGFDADKYVIETEPRNENGISRRLLAYVSLLNKDGIKKLEERAEELSELSKYRKGE